MEQLQWAVQRFQLMQFFAGAIQLALDVAQESDRGNRALSWIQDGRPEPVCLSLRIHRGCANAPRIPEWPFFSRGNDATT